MLIVPSTEGDPEIAKLVRPRPPRQDPPPESPPGA
jgi:hypothetical protein